MRNQVDPGSVVALVFIMLFLYLIFTARRLDCACAMLVAFVLTSFPVALQLAPLALMGAGGYVVGASVVCPSMLFDEIDMERPQEERPRPPVVAPPPLDSGN